MKNKTPKSVLKENIWKQSSAVNCQNYYGLTFSNVYNILSLRGDLSSSKITLNTAKEQMRLFFKVLNFLNFLLNFCSNMCYANRIEFFRNTLKIIFKWHCSKRPFTETNIFILYLEKILQILLANLNILK